MTPSSNNVCTNRDINSFDDSRTASMLASLENPLAILPPLPKITKIRRVVLLTFSKKHTAPQVMSCTPADNLYKFISITGLALALLSGWEHIKTDIALWENTNEFNRAFDFHIREVLKAKGQQFETLSDEIRTEDLSGDEIVRRYKEIRNDLPPGFKESLKPAGEVIEERVRINDKLSEERRFLLKFSFAIGVTLMLAVFCLWYIRVQKPADEMISLQLAEIRSRLGASAATVIGASVSK